MHPINKIFPTYREYSDYNRIFAVGDVVTYIETLFIENGILLDTYSDGRFDTYVIYFNNTSIYKINFNIKKTITHKQAEFISELLTSDKYSYTSDCGNGNGKWCIDIQFDISISNDGIDYVKEYNMVGNRIVFEFFLEDYLYYIRSRKIKEIYES